MTHHVDTLKKVLANTYALLLKTQNYHWHVKGAHFPSLHHLFEGQYNDLFAIVDDLAERIVTLKEQAPASFDEFAKLNVLSANRAAANEKEMLNDLIESHKKLIELYKTLAADAKGDLVTEGLAIDKLGFHEKTLWMLQATAS